MDDVLGPLDAAVLFFGAIAIAGLALDGFLTVGGILALCAGWVVLLLNGLHVWGAFEGQ